jgi:hypothetical protein
LKTTIEQIHKSRTKSFLKDLADPVIQGNFDLLKPAQKKMLNVFIAAKELADEVSQEFLASLQRALSGLATLSVRLDDLTSVLLPDGSPATAAEFK